MHLAYMHLCPKRHQFAGERSVQLEYVGVGYSDPSASVLPGRSAMVETMASEALWTNQSSLCKGHYSCTSVLTNPLPLDRME